MIKKLLAIIVLVMVASLSIAGCTTNNTNQTPSATASAATHDAFLENYIAAGKNVMYSDSSIHVQAWELDWINSTSARLQFTELNKTTNQTVNADETFMVFPTTQDATNYLNAMNLTAYSLASTEYTSGGAYQITTGHAPQIYKEYKYNEGNPFNISEYKLHEIQQVDNIVLVSTTRELS